MLYSFRFVSIINLFFSFLTIEFYLELPLEPSLSRTLIEANELGCLSEALTVTAMLSVETVLIRRTRSINYFLLMAGQFQNLSFIIIPYNVFDYFHMIQAKK